MKKTFTGLALTLPMVWLVVLLGYFAPIHLVPGDPVQLIQKLREAQVAEIGLASEPAQRLFDAEISLADTMNDQGAPSFCNVAKRGVESRESAKRQEEDHGGQEQEEPQSG